MIRQGSKQASAPSIDQSPVFSLQRKCDCGAHTPQASACPACSPPAAGLQRQLSVGASDDPFEREAERVADDVMAQPAAASIGSATRGIQRLSTRPTAGKAAAPPSVMRAIAESGRPLDGKIRQDMQGRFGYDFSQVRVHHGSSAAASARDVDAKAYTVGGDIVFGAGQFAPETPAGRRLLAHELTHTIQQSSSPRLAAPSARASTDAAATIPDDSPLAVQREAADGEEQVAPEEGAPAEETAKGFEINPEELIVLPRAELMLLPDDSDESFVQRQAAAPANRCDTPDRMTALISGSFLGGKTMDDYFPDLVGQNFWGSNNTAGPFDNGSRAGSSVQLIGQLPIPCATSPNPTTLAQSATIIRARANGSLMMENGRPLEGQTFDDIARSRRDQSRAPFRQTWVGAVSMADPISGIPYSTLRSYEWEVNLTTSLTGLGGTVSAGWGVTVEAAGGRVTRNTVR